MPAGSRCALLICSALENCHRQPKVPSSSVVNGLFGRQLAAKLPIFLLERRNLFRLERRQGEARALATGLQPGAPSQHLGRSLSRGVRARLEGIERGPIAHGLAGTASAGRRRALQRCRKSEPLEAFRPALGCEGRGRKAVLGERGIDGRNKQFARGCQLSMLSATDAGNTGVNRPKQAEFSTAGRHTFAGQITS